MLELYIRTSLIVWSAYVSHGALYDEYYNDARRCVIKCGIDYFGNLTTTVTGKPCRAWSQDDFATQIDLRELQNYCRNPYSLRKPMPWCYVSNQKWEYCFRSKCVDTAVYRSCGSPGFHYFNGSCHSVLPIPTTERKFAKQTCSSSGAHFFSTISSAEEIQFFNQLTCLPALVRGRYNVREQQWKLGNRPVWRINQPGWPWCDGYPIEQTKNRCLLLQNRCFKSLPCYSGGSPFYPACELDLSKLKFKAFESEEVSWTGGRETCESAGYELCNAADLCPETQRVAGAPFPTFHLPLNGDRWMPVHDEYGEWVYVGQDASKQCARRVAEHGPLEAFEKDRGQIVCCKPNNRTLSSSKPVTVNVSSAVFDFVVRYRFSLSSNLTTEQLADEDVLWTSGKRNKGDLLSFDLMSNYEEGTFETPVYFCSKPHTSEEGWRTTLYSINMTACQAPYKLDFYLFASETSDSGTLYVHTDSSGAAKLSSENVTSASYTNQNFSIRGASGIIPASKRITDPCEGIMKVYDANGVISAPRFRHNSSASGVRCKWRLLAPVDHVIRVNFSNLNLPDSGTGHRYYEVVNENERFRKSHGNVLFNLRQSCPHSTIQLRPPTGQRSSDTWVDYGTICGDIRPPSFITIGNKLVVDYWRRNISSRSSSDFRLTFEVLKPPAGLRRVALRRNDSTWITARNRCRVNGLDLCRQREICKYGDRPFYGVEDGNSMVPVRDEFNEWLQVGSLHGQACQRHNQQFGAPLWGLSSEHCAEEFRCNISRKIYCCENRANHQPPSILVNVTVYTAIHNGIVFQRYIRQGFDDPPAAADWSPNRLAYNDVQSFQLYHGLAPGFARLVYFCFKVLNPRVGGMKAAYTASPYPCSNGWRLQFYLYGALTNVTGPTGSAVPLYAGVYGRIPQHTRFSFHHYQPEFRSPQSFVVYGLVSQGVPEARVSAQDEGALLGSCKQDGVVYMRTPATVVSPNYNSPYPPDMLCQWLVHRPAEHRSNETQLQLTVQDLTLEEDSACENDHVEIHEVEYVNDHMIRELRRLRRLCGYVSGQTVMSTHALLIKFKSDGSIERSGFKIRIEAVRTGCGGNVTENGAIVHSPGFPNRYVPGLQCDWWIRSPSEAYVVEIQFDKIALAQSEGCTVDYISVGPNTNHSAKKLCGVLQQPLRVRVNSSFALVRFHTDQSRTQQHPPPGKGFAMTVHFVPSPTGAKLLSHRDCGQADVAPWSVRGTAQQRIIGGTVARPGSWPWVVFVEGANCGGSLISDRWVVTAAHCIVPAGRARNDWSQYKPDMSSHRVVVGRHFRNQDSTETKYKIAKVVIHPQHGRTGSVPGARDIPVNDIALLQLATSVSFGPAVKPICLPDSDAHVGEVCVIAGWGNEGTVSAFPRDQRKPLKYAKVPILRNSLCNSWPKLRGNVKPDELCAGYADGGTDSCWGDSGGPLMCSGAGGKYYLKGVVSWGKGCGKPLQPGIYARVWSHYQWIRDVVFGQP